MTPQDLDTCSLEELIAFATERELIRGIVPGDGKVEVSFGNRVFHLTREQAHTFMQSIVRSYLKSRYEAEP